MIVYTSRSTGQPKGCMLPKKSIFKRALIQLEQLAVPDYPRAFCPLPLNHVGAMQGVSAYSLIGAGTVNFRQKLAPSEVGKIVRENDINVLVMFPTMYQLICDHPNFDPADYRDVKCILFAGASIPVPLLDILAGLGNGNVRTCFGSTETCVGVLFSRQGLELEKLAVTVGHTVNNDARLVRLEDEGLCKPGEIGELQVHKEHFMQAYFNRAQANAEDFTIDGWVRTGDLLEQLPDGDMRFVARISVIFISGGYNVDPREIELELESHPDVVAAAVIGTPDKLYGEVGYAFLQLDGNQALVEAELRHWYKERLANYKIPKRYSVVGSIPLLPNGKIDKKPLRNKALEALK